MKDGDTKDRGRSGEAGYVRKILLHCPEVQVIKWTEQIGIISENPSFKGWC